jgi:hypothetical protein
MKHLRLAPTAALGFAFAVLALVGWPLADHASAQVQDQSPPSLVRFLTRPNDPDVLVAFSCGTDDEEQPARAAARSLVSQGTAAIPAIEDGLGLIEEGGPQAPSSLRARWLLYAYAKIKGRSAFGRLWRMSPDNPEIYSRLGLSPSSSLALALGLTSYVR